MAGNSGLTGLLSGADRARALEDFFEAALAAFPTASQQIQRGRLGPLDIELRTSPVFAERAWGSPLALRPPGKEPPRATFLIWDDSREEGGKLPSPPWGDQWVYTHRGDLRGFQSERIRVAYNFDCRLLSMWDRRARIGISWTPHWSALKPYEWAAPMRTLLYWCGLEHGLQMTHAAAVGLEGRGLLLAGKGGSGKSTTALACWSAGWQFVSDDYCWIAPGSPPTAYSVYATAKLLPHREADLPPWRADEALSHEKNVYRLSTLAEGQLVESLELAALLLPSVGAASTGLRPASARDGLAGLSLSTMAQLPQAGAETMQMLQAIAGALPAHHLDLSAPVSGVPPVLAQVLEP